MKKKFLNGVGRFKKTDNSEFVFVDALAGDKYVISELLYAKGAEMAKKGQSPVFAFEMHRKAGDLVWVNDEDQKLQWNRWMATDVFVNPVDPAFQATVEMVCAQLDAGVHEILALHGLSDDIKAAVKSVRKKS